VKRRWALKSEPISIVSTKEGTIIEKATGQECWSVLLLSQKKDQFCLMPHFQKKSQTWPNHLSLVKEHKEKSVTVRLRVAGKKNPSTLWPQIEANDVI